MFVLTLSLQSIAEPTLNRFFSSLRLFSFLSRSLVSELDGVGKATVLECGELGEGATSCDAEYNHVRGEGLRARDQKEFLEIFVDLNLRKTRRRGQGIHTNKL